jgi:hypothetical protein
LTLTNTISTAAQSGCRPRHFAHAVEDDLQPRRQVATRRLGGGDGAAGHIRQPRAVGIDDAKAGALQAGVDAEDAHRTGFGVKAHAQYQRTKWKNTGAAKHSGATRSSRPTAPVTEALVAPVAHAGVLLQRAHHEFAQLPLAAATRAMTAACQWSTGVIQLQPCPPAPPPPAPGRRRATRSCGRSAAPPAGGAASGWPAPAPVAPAATTITRKNSRKAPRPAKARQVQQQQRRCVAQAIDADHDAPLDLGVALEERSRVAGQRAGHRNGQEHVHRHEHREQVEGARAHQHVLQRQRKEEGEIRLRWSPRRVCTSVMNSRSARNEMAPKVSVAPSGPETQASQNTMLPSHSARRSRRSRRRRSRAASSSLQASAITTASPAPGAEERHEQQRHLLVDSQLAQRSQELGERAHRSRPA